MKDSIRNNQKVSILFIENNGYSNLEILSAILYNKGYKNEYYKVVSVIQEMLIKPIREDVASRFNKNV